MKKVGKHCSFVLDFALLLPVLKENLLLLSILIEIIRQNPESKLSVWRTLKKTLIKWSQQEIMTQDRGYTPEKERSEDVL